MTAKSNEILAVRDLLKMFASLAGAVITIDALHTQSDTAQVVTGRGADYVMTVKANMPTLYRQLKKLLWARIPAVSSVSTDHGRRARRTIKAVLASAWIGVRRRCSGRPGRAGPPRGHEEGQENRRGRLPHHQRLRCRPGHPGRLNPRPPGDREQAPLGPRDAYQEDKSLVRTGNAPRVMASCAAWPSASCASGMDGHANIAAANRHHARDPQRTLTLFRPHERLCRVPGGQAEPSSAWTRQATSPTEAVEI